MVINGRRNPEAVCHSKSPAMELKSKKGLRNPLEEAQVRKAVVALQAFLEKQRAADKAKKHELIGSTEYISCIITRKTVPAKASLKPLTMCVRHLCLYSL
jgi:hypothetical protein